MESSTDIWIEKYRPRKLDEVVGQKEIVDRLKLYASSKSLPHLLFTGSAGIGKTTCAVALAREMFGDTWSMNFRELNASDERGIDVVRTQIKQFARTSPLGDAEFKVLFLDEADALTNDAQAALRRTMENYAETCRFILSCNYSSKIIDPIQSRCAIYRFKP
ncbi:MAG TPA: replication factor C small subunit, partial [Methanocorpusculum sp.]|nr:replication factor C small subunit [Methanocorpusculum sp.]